MPEHTPLEIGIGAIALAAAIATGVQAYIANDTEKRSLRAYVFAEKLTVTLDGNNIRAIMDLKNGGQTPAYNVTASTQLYVDSADKPFNPKAPLSESVLSRGILGPGAILNPGASGPIPSPTAYIPALKNGTLAIYYYGQVEYTDAFSRTWILDFRTRNSPFNGTGWLMQPTEEGNNEREKPYTPARHPKAK
jgi:hypothetical protein